MNRWDTIVKPIAGAAEIQDHRAPSLNLGRVDRRAHEKRAIALPGRNQSSSRHGCLPPLTWANALYGRGLIAAARCRIGGPSPAVKIRIEMFRENFLPARNYLPAATTATP